MKMEMVKRVLSVFLVVLLLLTAAPLATLPQAQATYAVGDHIQFGTYPQTLVTDESLISKLNAANKTWKSFEYYTGSGNMNDSSMLKSDYMQFADFFFMDKKYRAVVFSSYRPNRTFYTSSSDNSYQDDNGYCLQTVYFFKYEPLKWRILDPETGYIMCESIIDAQPFQNTIVLFKWSLLSVNRLYRFGKRLYWFFY